MHREPLDLPPLAELAARVGLTPGRHGYGPCPACNAERRSEGKRSGHPDTRPPVVLFAGRDGERWRCHACNAGGDGIALLAAARWREVPGRGDPRWAELFAELRADGGGSRGSIPAAPRPVAPRPPPGRYNDAPAVPGEPDEHPGRSAEARALWTACVPVNAPGLRRTEAAPDWLHKRRGIDLDRLAAVDVVRVLPRVWSWPKWTPWAGMPRALWIGVYRLASPVYDALGELRALRFRAVPEHLEAGPDGLRWSPAPGLESSSFPTSHGPPVEALSFDGRDGPRRLVKALSPMGSVAGLVMADPWALALLRNRGAGPVEVDGVRWDGRVVVAEGEPDLWTTATQTGRIASDGRTWATFGIEAGAWSEAIAARVPDGAELAILVHHDDAGDRYAEAIRATVAHRCRVSRSKPTATRGSNDAYHA